jgi:hypothetical protein
VNRRAFFAGIAALLGIKVAPKKKFVPSLSEAERIAYLKFYAGDQWPPEVRAVREAMGRPCLTINRLPQMAHRILHGQKLPVTPEQEEAIAIGVVRQYADQQRVYNYIASAHAEAEAAKAGLHQYGDYLWSVGPKSPSVIFFSQPQDPDAWPEDRA